MRQLQAKFKVGSVVDYGNKNIEANLTAVTGDSEENKTFSIYTPSATCKMHITNPDALDFFVASGEYVAVFTRVETLAEKKERYLKEGAMFSIEPLVNIPNI